MTVPVFREFLEQNQEVKVIFISRENFSALFHDIPRLHFHGVNLNHYKGLHGLQRLGNNLLHLYKPDYIADFHDIIRAKILDLYFKTKGHKVYKIDKGKSEKKELIDIWNIEKKPLKRTVERYADILRKMGFPVELSYKLRPQTGEKSGIGFAPFAQHKGKTFPLEKSFILAQKLAQRAPLYFFGGGAKENELLAKWEKQIPNATSLAGKLSLKEELDYIANLEFMVSMDSANMHLASLVGTRCISIWGSTHPYAGFLGYGQSMDDVVQIEDLTCRPCGVYGENTCYRGDWACLNELSVSMILDKI